MFAPKVAKPQTKAPEASTSRLGLERSTPARHGFDRDLIVQARFLQRTIGNQAIQRLTAKQDSLPDREIGLENTAVPIERNDLSQDFSKIPAFSPERASQEQPSFSPPAARFAGAIRAKLEVGAVDDPLEREADQVAEQVMRMPNAVAVTSPAVAGGGIPGMQRKCSCGGTCAECRGEHSDEEHGKAQRQSPGPQVSRLDPSPANSGITAPPTVHEVLNSPGQPLHPEARAFFEPRFGYDLSTIRVHSDDKAAESARAINARAYAVGRRIVFGSNQYSPETMEGKRLLAHELSHSFQQFQGSERSGQAQSRTIRSSPHTRVMRAPPQAYQPRSCPTQMS